MVALLERIKRISDTLLHSDDRGSALFAETAPPYADEDSEVSFSRISGDPAGTRKAHSSRHLIAYWVIPQFFFEQAEAFYASLIEDGAGVLRYTWANLCIRRREMPQKQDLDTIDAQSMPVLERKCAWITLPNPATAGEAYYAAVVGEDRAGDGWRYFLLEKTLTSSGEPLGVLCDRRPDGTTLNLGLTAPPDLMAFQELVRTQLMRERCQKVVRKAPVEALVWEEDDVPDEDIQEEVMEAASVQSQIRWAP